MLRFHSVAFVAALLLTMIFASLHLLFTVEASASALRQAPEQCAWLSLAAARPKAALVGEEITATVSIAPSCPESVVPLHVVFVLDGSGSMAGEPNRELKKWARNLIQRLNMKDNPATQVGVVMYSSEATVLCPLTNRSGTANGCVGRVGAAGGSRLRAGIDEGLQVLADGREDVSDSAAVHEVIVVMSNDVDDCEAAVAAAGRAREQGVRIAAVRVCDGSVCEEACLPRIADGPDLYFQSRNGSAVTLLLAEQRGAPPTGWPFTTWISATVPAAFDLVADSPSPDASVIAPGGRALSWRSDRMPGEGITVTWRLRALAPGLHEVGPLIASASTVTGTQSVTIGITSPQVLVVAPRELATATPEPEPTVGGPNEPEPGATIYLPLALPGS